jgi:hypothetical protein
MANATLILRLTALRLLFDYRVEENDRPNNPVFRGGAIHGYGYAVFRSPGLPIKRARSDHDPLLQTPQHDDTVCRAEHAQRNSLTSWLRFEVHNAKA